MLARRRTQTKKLVVATPKVKASTLVAKLVIFESLLSVFRFDGVTIPKVLQSVFSKSCYLIYA
ncbi:hypothetical protein CPL00134L_CDS0076 [Escherichia phage Phagiculus]